MDPDVFPNSIEYWGPTGMVFFRNVQVRWMPIQGDTNLTFALERPGASGDAGVLADRIELQNIRARFPLPDFSGAYKLGRDWGYVRAAGMLRKIEWDDVLDDDFELSGDAWGWGINLSSNLKPSDGDTIRLQFVFGEGIQNYMNDSPVDVGIVANPGNLVTPILGRDYSHRCHRRVSRSLLEREVQHLGRLLVAGERQHGGTERQRVQDRPLRAFQPPPLSGAERHGGRRIPVGPPRELRGWFRE